jgi:hypothetical protein
LYYCYLSRWFIFLCTLWYYLPRRQRYCHVAWKLCVPCLEKKRENINCDIWDKTVPFLNSKHSAAHSVLTVSSKTVTWRSSQFDHQEKKSPKQKIEYSRNNFPEKLALKIKIFVTLAAELIIDISDKSDIINSEL